MTDCQACFDHRYPSYNTINLDNVAGQTLPSRRGYLPAGSYQFSKEGAVFDYCNGNTLQGPVKFFTTGGPRYGVTMGACVPRAVQSSLIDKTGGFTTYSVFGAPTRGCYL
jgi:hypothetical protein